MKRFAFLILKDKNIVLHGFKNKQLTNKIKNIKELLKNLV